MKTVLVYCEDYTQMEKLVDQLELGGFNSIPCLSPDDVKRCIELTVFDLLLIGEAVHENSKALIKNEMEHVHSSTIIFEHYGEIDNLLAEVKQAIGII